MPLFSLIILNYAAYLPLRSSNSYLISSLTNYALDEKLNNIFTKNVTIIFNYNILCT